MRQPERHVGAHIAIVGAGFTGLSAALELARAGIRVTVLESDHTIGGLAGSFDAAGTPLEKFYHHWFTSDVALTGLVEELGLRDRLIAHDSRTGMYYSQRMHRLSTPLDLLRFSPLNLIDRARLGLLVPRARAVRRWQDLESVSAREWLIRTCGPNVFRVVWEPLLRGKFGAVADEISAVWIWNKLFLRGGSRDRTGKERLLYFQGGFTALAAELARTITDNGGAIHCGSPALHVHQHGVDTPTGNISADAVLITTPLPIAADLLQGEISPGETASLRRIRYLANVCLVLRLDRSLSSLYWINVNDPSFPFVGVIEHTNFESPASYGGEHVVYLSRYLPESDPLYTLSDDAYLAYAFPYLQRMFPGLSSEHLHGHHVWRARYAQPVIERNYSSLIPSERTSVDDVYLCSMAQIYPEDRGTNYAIAHGRRMGRALAQRYGARACAPV